MLSSKQFYVSHLHHRHIELEKEIVGRLKLFHHLHRFFVGAERRVGLEQTHVLVKDSEVVSVKCEGATRVHFHCG